MANSNHTNLSLPATIKRPISPNISESVPQKPRLDPATRNKIHNEDTDNRYKLIEFIQQGTFGIVSKVEKNDDPAKIYAQKQLSIRKMGMESIQKEIEAIRRVQHQHIIKVIDDFARSKQGWYYIIMDPVADSDLTEYLENVIRNPSSELEREKFGQQRLLLLGWICCLAGAVQHIHSLDVRHRDIKPANILIHGTNILLTDFGTSYHSEHDTRYTGTEPSGTPKYTPPEAFGKRRFGRSGDIYSLGCVFWEMIEAISGLLLYRALPDIAKLDFPFVQARNMLMEQLNDIKEHAVMKGRLVENARFPENFPQPVLSLIIDMLHQDPKVRPVAGIVVDTLDRILAEMGSTPPPCCAATLYRRSNAVAALTPWQKSVVQRIIGTNTSELIVTLNPVYAMSILANALAFVPDVKTTIVIIPATVLHRDLYTRMQEYNIKYLTWTPGEKKMATIVFMSAEAICTQDFIDYYQRLYSMKKLNCIITFDCDFYVSSGHYVLWAQIIQTRTKKVWFNTTPEFILDEGGRSSFFSKHFVQKPDIMSSTINRPNIRYSIQHCESGRKLCDSAEDLIRSWIGLINLENPAIHASESKEAANTSNVALAAANIGESRIIVYCYNRQDFQDLKNRLNCPNYVNKSGYVNNNERDDAIQLWHIPEGSPVILVAESTSYGLDYPSVRWILHVGVPWNMSKFTRDSGMAGRDGQNAESVVLVRAPDQLYPDDGCIQQYLAHQDCLRGIISKHLGEHEERMNEDDDQQMSNGERWRLCVDGVDQLCSVCVARKEANL